MTTPELEPRDIVRLQLQKELRQGFCSPIEEEAIQFLHDVSARIQDRDLLHRATQFATNLVGWRSSDADPMTGRVVIGRFDLKEEFGKTIDHFAQLFLTKSNSVSASSVLQENGTEIMEYSYEQFRKNGKVRKVSIRRQPAQEESVVEYSVGYVDIGEHSGGSEILLDIARLSLQANQPNEISGDFGSAIVDTETDTQPRPQKARLLRFLV